MLTAAATGAVVASAIGGSVTKKNNNYAYGKEQLAALRSIVIVVRNALEVLKIEGAALEEIAKDKNGYDVRVDLAKLLLGDAPSPPAEQLDNALIDAVISKQLLGGEGIPDELKMVESSKPDYQIQLADIKNGTGGFPNTIDINDTARGAIAAIQNFILATSSEDMVVVTKQRVTNPFNLLLMFMARVFALIGKDDSDKKQGIKEVIYLLYLQRVVDSFLYHTPNMNTYVPESSYRSERQALLSNLSRFIVLMKSDIYESLRKESISDILDSLTKLRQSTGDLLVLRLLKIAPGARYFNVQSVAQLILTMQDDYMPAAAKQRLMSKGDLLTELEFKQTFAKVTADKSLSFIDKLVFITLLTAKYRPLSVHEAAQQRLEQVITDSRRQASISKMAISASTSFSNEEGSPPAYSQGSSSTAVAPRSHQQMSDLTFTITDKDITSVVPFFSQDQGSLGTFNPAALNLLYQVILQQADSNSLVHSSIIDFERKSPEDSALLGDLLSHAKLINLMGDVDSLLILANKMVRKLGEYAAFECRMGVVKNIITLCRSNIVAMQGLLNREDKHQKAFLTFLFANSKYENNADALAWGQEAQNSMKFTAGLRSNIRLMERCVEKLEREVANYLEFKSDKYQELSQLMYVLDATNNFLVEGMRNVMDKAGRSAKPLELVMVEAESGPAAIQQAMSSVGQQAIDFGVGTTQRIDTQGNSNSSHVESTLLFGRRTLIDKKEAGGPFTPKEAQLLQNNAAQLLAAGSSANSAIDNAVRAASANETRQIEDAAADARERRKLLKNGSIFGFS